jgi:hypothetical protein
VSAARFMSGVAVLSRIVAVVAHAAQSERARISAHNSDQDLPKVDERPQVVNHPSLTGARASMRTSHLIRVAVLLLAVPQPVAAQPGTDIFVADASVHEGRLTIGVPTNVTQREGYDNQPWFTSDGSAFLYVSERGGQTDIFRYDLRAGLATRITNTPENEYSPTLPGDGSRMLVVRWPTDMSTGALWWFTPEGEPLEQARGSVPRVGYYTFADDHTLALFINDSIQSFMLSDTRTGDTTRVGQSMGGSGPRTIPGARAVSFLRQRGEDGWWLHRLELDSGMVTPLVPMLKDVANYTWTAHGTVLAATGGTIHEWTPGGSWKQLVTFTDPALQEITRIAISPTGDRIVFVSARP